MKVKVIKNGIFFLKKMLRFECRKCGCVYLVHKKDVLTMDDYMGLVNGYRSYCPECNHNNVILYKELISQEEK